MPTLAQKEFDFLRQLVYERSRIHLGPDKEGMVERRVQKRLTALGLREFSDYCDLLRLPTGEPELTSLMDAISTNVTDFFRERQHFDFLVQEILPVWRRREGRPVGVPFRVWSAACSSGEEPYSIAMALADFFKADAEARWQVDASDLSTRMLDQASRGIYRCDHVRLPEPTWLRRYFQRGVGRSEGYYRIKRELRERVAFYHLNLFAPSLPLAGGYQVIFCRNVMIYFDHEAQEELVNRLSRWLAPDGYLFVGHSESLINIRHSLKCVKPSIYRPHA